jgi:hypothetical protein
MGYINSATTTTLTAKLTPVGRKKLILTNNNLITHFSLGDSDANYYSAMPLLTGQIPGDGGDNGPYSSLTNSVGPDVSLKSMLIVNKNGDLKKAVEPQSSELTTQMIANGSRTFVTTRKDVVDRTQLNTDPLTNLYYSFNLPLNAADDYKFTGITNNKSGFADTALSGIAQSKILVIGIDNSEFGEVIDGKTIRAYIQGTTTLFTLYSTFQNTNQQLTVLDAQYSEQSTSTSSLGKNIAFLFSDEIQTPNGGDPSLSWSTGYGTVKPFSVNNKQLFNFMTNKNIGKTADTVVGIAYLDKGFIVITHPTIINDFDITVPTNWAQVTCDSLSTSVIQNVTCIANRGEFGNSTNPTYKSDNTPRISEIGLYDTDGDLIAIAKTDRHIIKNVNEFLALGVKFNV